MLYRPTGPAERVWRWCRRKPVVRDAADTAVNVPYLDTILYLLGIPRDAVDAADLGED